MSNPTVVVPVQVPAEQYGQLNNESAPRAYTQSPLLRPNIGVPDGAAGGGIGSTVLRSRSDFLKTHTRAAAEVTMSLGGSFASGHTIDVIFTSPPFPSGAITVAYTSVGSDTTATALGDHLAGAINESAACQAYGISASAAAGVLKLYHNGPVGNYDTVSFTSTGSESATFSNPAGGTTGIMSGGGGPLFAWQGFSITLGGQLFVAQAGSVNLWDTTLIAVAVNEGHAVA